MATFTFPRPLFTLKRKTQSSHWVGHLAALSLLVVAVAGLVHFGFATQPAESRPLLPALLAPDPVDAYSHPSILPRTKAIAPVRVAAAPAVVPPAFIAT